MNIKVKECTPKPASEAREKVTLRIEGGHVSGFTYEMAKALENEDVSIFVADTGPFGEDEKAEIISFDAGQAEGEFDLGGGDKSTPEDIYDIIVIDREFGQSDCNWADFSGEQENVYILAGDLDKAASAWSKAGLI